jgi:hypothetical protein
VEMSTGKCTFTSTISEESFWGDRVAIALYRPCGDLHQLFFETGCQTKGRGSDDGPGWGSTIDAPGPEKASEAA